MPGIVVTHGTARLEETAFFLYLTVRSDRPVVVVGAQRPPTGISPDGPINLLSAIRVAAAPQSRGKGVTAVMDDRIISARDVTKSYARGGGFDAAEMGTLGIVATGGVEFFYQPVRKHTASADFDVASLESLPRVGISYSYSGAQGVADLDAKAVIVATTGFAPEEATYYDALRRKGVIVAATFPSGEQVDSSPDAPGSPLPPVVAVKHLMPTKARILMMLALTKNPGRPGGPDGFRLVLTVRVRLRRPVPVELTVRCAAVAQCAPMASASVRARTRARPIPANSHA